jgi:thiol-disulfide isomerase/thioredoxin
MVFIYYKSKLYPIKGIPFLQDGFKQVKTMKIITVALLLFFLLPFCEAQNKGKITSVSIRQKAGIEKLYIYQPHKNLLLPDKIEALVLYQVEQQVYRKYIPVKKVDNEYQFLFQPPDSVSVLVIGMVDAKINNADYSPLVATRKKVVDNNSGAGFIFFLHDKQGKSFVNEKIVLAGLLQKSAPYYLDTKTENGIQVKMYEAAYKSYPALIKEDSYLDYLTLLFGEKGNVVKSKLLAYASQMKKVQNNEKKWLNAGSIYRLLGITEEQQEIEHRILKKYPNGELAKQKFWANFYKFYKKEGDTEQSILDSMNNYISWSKDSSNKVKDDFYAKINSLFFDKKEWGKVAKYETLVSDRFNTMYSYNYLAWKLCGGQLDNEGTDLEIAKVFSKKSIDYIEECIKKSTTNNDPDLNLNGALNKYINTYALILYKLGQYDSAFYYQDSLYQQGGELNVAGMERYVAYAEKVKGVNYARQVLEQQFFSGVNSPILVNQLLSIYKQLNLPESEFGALQKKYKLIFKQKAAATVSAQMGTTKAINFSLKNMLGQKVSLSSFKNKVVVLDFWATWCGPCIASFPAMQEAVNKYKMDSEVVFLFIDVWENAGPKKINEIALKFMKDIYYSFNVLLDTKNVVVTAYKIKSIPTKIVIDKLGNIISIGNLENIEVEIESARN